MNFNTYTPKFYKVNSLLAILFFIFNLAFSQTPQDSTATKSAVSLGTLKMPNPSSIASKYTYDPTTDRYIYTESVGNFDINYPVILTAKEYQKLINQQNLKAYYKDKIDAYDGKKENSKEAQKNLLPEFYVKSGLFESIFGSGTIEVVPQGSVEMDLGLLYTKQDNPAFSPRNRSNLTFDFDQRISLSMLGKVGTRLQVTANYDTQSTFDFQNLVKLEYTPTEDDIIQKIEVGNVNMPLNSSLITGAQSLFGVKTQLQFGKTTITSVFSEQKSDARTVVAQGGGTLEEFDFFIRDYDENRHFFLAQYFRDTYDKALADYPFLNTNVQITRIEVWITNRSNTTDNVRNIVAFQDLAETNKRGDLAVNISAGPNAYPDNANNSLDPTKIGEGGSQLSNAVRNIATVQAGILIPGFKEGADYVKLENAKKLIEGQEYTLHPQLGYISLNQRLTNDEVLSVAFQFTVGGKVYQVGEFANDGAVETNTTGTVPSNAANSNLVLKMLKSSVTNVDEPVWDLMMKNIYDTGAYQLSQEDFKLNIFYNEAAPLNYITPVEGTPFGVDFKGKPIEETTLLRLFNFDKLNFNNDPQANGDGFFDFVPGVTVIPQNGKIVFTKAEPFGRYLFNVLDNDNNPTNNEDDYKNTASYNPNQKKYVYDVLYKSTKTKALDENEKNKFQIRGRYKSSGGDGIPIGGFNVPRGSVKVTANGRLLTEGVDYTVNYQLGRVQILDEALKASNVPIQVSTENNSIFGQQTKRYTGLNIEHKFNKNFLVGATYINLNERPITQKANYNSEPINNTVLGLNTNFSTEVPFLTRLTNKLPSTDTDAISNFSLRGEFAYLLPGAPKGTSFNNEVTSYIDDFEGTQNGIDLKSPQSWFLSSRPLNINGVSTNDVSGIQNGYGRALLNWYTIDPIFYSSRRPTGISNDDVSDIYSSRVFINELFPQQDIAQGQTTVLNTLDLTYYPNERGPYNFEPGTEDNVIDTPTKSWAGITRQLTSTDFEQSNVEYIEFWLQDPFQKSTSNAGGELVFNLGNISEDVLRDGYKQYENGLPKDGNIELLPKTDYQTVVPQNQALIYTFDTAGGERENQDVGYDGYNDAEEGREFPAAFSTLTDPANDNYKYFLTAEGDILNRYKGYNGTQGNSPDIFSETNRGSTTQPDVEDVNRDYTMNTIDSYFEYKLNVTPSKLNIDNDLIVDTKVVQRVMPNGNNETINWYQFRIPISAATSVNGISDLRSIRFARMYLTGFNEKTTLRFGTLELVRSDWRRYRLSLNKLPVNPNTTFSVGAISTQDNDGSYQSPPGVVPEQLNNNNSIIRQNEQSLLVNVCDLEADDARAVYKNINVDMRQFKKLRMFMHAQNGDDITNNLGDAELVGFVRMGNDLTENYYQMEVPLVVSQGASSPEQVWPQQNEINIPLEYLQKIKALGISNGTLINPEPVFYDIVNGNVQQVANPTSGYVVGQQRIAIKGNPNFGDIRTLMVGVKNIANRNACGQVWFNELRLSDMDNEGGWASVVSMDTNLADFANITATGRMSTSGFGSVEQGPNERSREEIKQYDFVTNVNLGQLLPKKWGIQIPFNYGQGEELITPEYDQQYKDITLKTRLDNAKDADDKKEIRQLSEDYTRRKSINFIGVRKNRTGDGKPYFFDVENVTTNFSYNKTEHRDFEIENATDKQVRAGVNYAYNFVQNPIEPFKKNDSIFTNKYWKFLKDFNFNYLPASVTFNTDFKRQYNRQLFRDLDLGAGNIGLSELFRRNYGFDYQYAINYNLTNAMQFNYSASRNNIVRNYFVNNNLVNGEQDPRLDIWDDFFNIGDPNVQNQQLGFNYDLPFSKFPMFNFMSATYSYTGQFQWQKGSDSFKSIVAEDGNTYDLGHSVSNSNTHTINSSLELKRLYKYLGVKTNRRRSSKSKNTAEAGPPVPNDLKKDDKKKKKKKKRKQQSKLGNFAVDLLTSVKRVQLNYSENNGSFLPGFLHTPGFLGTSTPTLGYTLGSQEDVRQIAAQNGWLTLFPNFNQQYTQNRTRQLDISANLQPIRDFKIDLVGFRTYAKNYTENYRVNATNEGLEYQSLTPNNYGNYSISVFTLPTAFGKSDLVNSDAFNTFKANRLVVAKRLATAKGIDLSNPENVDAEGYPLGFSKTSQAVLLPAFLSAYSGEKASKTTLSALRDVPLPNWDIKYTGLMKLKWFKKQFKRFSLNHGYRSSYTINQFRDNLDYSPINFALAYNTQPADVLNQAGDYKNEKLYSNVNITEAFSPLMRLDFEMKNSIKIVAEMKRDRMLSLSFDNNLLTEVQGKEYIVGLGYRIKDVRIKSKLAGPKKSVVSDLNMKADISVRDNKAMIRYLNVNNNQITNGQTIWGIKYSADYAFSKNLTGIFYFDYSFSKYAISTAFPQTTIRSGLTLRYNFGN